jgi:hypothetical protein
MYCIIIFKYLNVSTYQIVRENDVYPYPPDTDTCIRIHASLLWNRVKATFPQNS